MNLRPGSKKGAGTAAAVEALKPTSRVTKRKSGGNNASTASSPTPSSSHSSQTTSKAKKQGAKDRQIVLTEEERKRFLAWEQQKVKVASRLAKDNQDKGMTTFPLQNLADMVFSNCCKGSSPC